MRNPRKLKKTEEPKKTEELKRTEETPGKLIMQTKCKKLSWKAVNITFSYMSLFLMTSINNRFLERDRKIVLVFKNCVDI